MAIPPTSPRLPSPPPAAEIQIGPKSPATSRAMLAQQQMEQQMEQTIVDANAKRRIHPGTRAADFAAGPPLVPLTELDSAFQLQEHLAALHYFHTGNNTLPITRETAHLLAQAPAGTDRTMWLYELCRFLIAQCNSLIVGFLFDTPACSAVTCPEMRASEWQFLCAVHEQPRSCCAIDYCCHTLDWAANVVTNPKIFPSRFVFADAHDKNAAVKNLINVFRRLHRIFAHAWFLHRGVFWSVETQTGLYVFFKTVCDMYDLLPVENYKLPPEAEGLNATAALTSGAGATPATEAPAEAPAPGLIPMSSIADKKSLGFGPASSSAAGTNAAQRSGSAPGTNGTGLAADLIGGDSEHLQSIGRTNTRRHIRSSPSTGSAVTTVLEQDEDPASTAGAPPPSLATGRPISILQNNHHLAPPLSQAVPSVTEKGVPADDNDEAEASSVSQGAADETTASVPIIVKDSQRDLPSVTPSEETSESSTTEPTADAPEPETTEAPNAPDASSADVADEKPEEEEPEPVTIIVAGELAEAGLRAAAPTASADEEHPKAEPSAETIAEPTTSSDAAEMTEEASAPEKQPEENAPAPTESTAADANTAIVTDATEEPPTPTAEAEATKAEEEAPKDTDADTVEEDKTEAVPAEAAPVVEAETAPEKHTKDDATDEEEPKPASE